MKLAKLLLACLALINYANAAEDVSVTTASVELESSSMMVYANITYHESQMEGETNVTRRRLEGPDDSEVDRLTAHTLVYLFQVYGQTYANSIFAVTPVKAHGDYADEEDEPSFMLSLQIWLRFARSPSTDDVSALTVEAGYHPVYTENYVQSAGESFSNSEVTSMVVVVEEFDKSNITTPEPNITMPDFEEVIEDIKDAIEDYIEGPTVSPRPSPAPTVEQTEEPTVEPEGEPIA